MDLDYCAGYGVGCDVDYPEDYRRQSASGWDGLAGSAYEDETPFVGIDALRDEVGADGGPSAG
jgi:hypothetical protein